MLHQLKTPRDLSEKVLHPLEIFMLLLAKTIRHHTESILYLFKPISNLFETIQHQSKSILRRPEPRLHHFKIIRQQSAVVQPRSRIIHFLPESLL